MRSLLDVNVLVALFDADHVDHRRVRTWLETEIEGGWASCAITQNGLLRILSQPRYPSPIPVVQAARRLALAAAPPHHEYWTCEVSLLDATRVDWTRIHGPRQVTDVYLLSLAVSRGGRFVTLDSAVPLGAVRGAEPRHLARI